MALDQNLIRRKYDYVAKLFHYNVNLNRDCKLILEYDYINPEVFRLVMDKEYPEFAHTNSISSIIGKTKYEFDELNKRLTSFVNGLD